MRTATLAMAMILTLVGNPTPLLSATRKAPPADVGAGRVAWFDLREARVMIKAAQTPFLDRLERAVSEQPS